MYTKVILLASSAFDAFQCEELTPRLDHKLVRCPPGALAARAMISGMMRPHIAGARGSAAGSRQLARLQRALPHLGGAAPQAGNGSGGLQGGSGGSGGGGSRRPTNQHGGSSGGDGGDDSSRGGWTEQCWEPSLGAVALGGRRWPTPQHLCLGRTLRAAAAQRMCPAAVRGCR